MSGCNGFDDARIKHMELIQEVIARLANESGLVRGLAITIAAAFFGFAARSLSWRIAAVGLLPVVVFWGLHVYYLRAERRYRRLYDRVRRADPDVEPFSMDASREPIASAWDVAPPPDCPQGLRAPHSSETA
jgi:hypothetical protein